MEHSRHFNHFTFPALPTFASAQSSPPHVRDHRHDDRELAQSDHAVEIPCGVERVQQVGNRMSIKP